MGDGPKSFAEYDRMQIAAYKVEQTNGVEPGSSYRVDRRLREIASKPVEHNTLPLHNGLTLTEIVAQKLKTQPHVSVLDMGCGKGSILEDLSNEFSANKTNLELHGITAYNYGQPDASNVAIEIGDLHRLEDLVQNKQFDVIYSYAAMAYVKRHWADIIKTIYSHLAPNGVALISYGRDDFYKKVGKNDRDKIQHWLSTSGYDIDIRTTKLAARHEDFYFVHKLSMQKTKPELVMPVNYFDWNRGVTFKPPESSDATNDTSETSKWGRVVSALKPSPKNQK